MEWALKFSLHVAKYLATSLGRKKSRYFGATATQTLFSSLVPRKMRQRLSACCIQAASRADWLVAQCSHVSSPIRIVYIRRALSRTYLYSPSIFWLHLDRTPTAMPSIALVLASILPLIALLYTQFSTGLISDLISGKDVVRAKTPIVMASTPHFRLVLELTGLCMSADQLSQATWKRSRP